MSDSMSYNWSPVEDWNLKKSRAKTDEGNSFSFLEIVFLVHPSSFFPFNPLSVKFQIDYLRMFPGHIMLGFIKFKDLKTKANEC